MRLEPAAERRRGIGETLSAAAAQSHDVRQPYLIKTLSNIGRAWRRLLVDLEFAKNYPVAYSLNASGVAVRNPVLEQLLPSLLHIKAVAVLDAALKDTLAQRSLKAPRELGTGLKARITFLAQRSLLPSPERLHRIRESRNDVAHEFEGHVSWDELGSDVDAIQEVLQAMGYAGARPAFKVVAERSAARGSAQQGVAFAFDYSVAVKEGDRTVAEIKWTERVLDDDD